MSTTLLSLMESSSLFVSQTATSFGNFNFGNFRAILGGLFALILIICFVAAVAAIAWQFFVAKNKGGADMGVVWKMIVGIMCIIVFSLVWAAVFGQGLTVDADTTGFNNIGGAN